MPRTHKQIAGIDHGAGDKAAQGCRFVRWCAARGSDDDASPNRPTRPRRTRVTIGIVAAAIIINWAELIRRPLLLYGNDSQKFIEEDVCQESRNYIFYSDGDS